ncbi:kinase domain protein (macronuclear) [Tetrahymena thermophila SB210]|uniref:Kinase domain protein n=1 Tax=Tetrahymena thermophila (strain SB210) TaxID=312017 RepID=Q24FT3_TETTS|nr:kinase domain protein [Tetrahymena thermophila SB210]EAS06637.3 kinase domain protein [Tetrahymena thermophila SB210]|eukprot:XP_001026882.3 kinase domain protein [Tetrahymena thermophila SB210]
MDNWSQLQQRENIKLKLIQHIQNRQKIKQMYADKGIQMLNKEQQLVSQVQQPNMSSEQSDIFDTMVDELRLLGYDQFKYLGKGGQGLVLLAKQKQSNRRYAIKGVKVKDKKGILDENTLKEVQQEINTLNQCKGSPYVANFIGQIEGQQFIYLVLTECLGSLSELIKQTQNGVLNEITAIKYAKDIAEGLDFIHSRNCVVNDIKMDNILIDYNGNAVVSDFGYANKTGQSGYSFEQYKGNFDCQAPECFTQFDIYSKKYKEQGVDVKQKPSPRSEAFSLGYLIYIMIQGWNLDLVVNKHIPLKYNEYFQSFVYKKQLQYIIDGLTKFKPRERLEIKEVLIILKGIISFEFQLDSKFIEVIDDGAAQDIIKSFNSDIEFIQGYEKKFYPIIQNEQDLIQQLNSEIHEHIKQQNEVISKQKQEIQNLEDEINDLLLKDQQINQQQIIQPFIQNQQANSNQVINQHAEMEQQQGQNDNFLNQYRDFTTFWNSLQKEVESKYQYKLIEQLYQSFNFHQQLFQLIQSIQCSVFYYKIEKIIRFKLFYNRFYLINWHSYYLFSFILN